MFEQFGNKDKLIIDLYRYVPTIIYRNNNNCFGSADVISVWRPEDDEVNSWSEDSFEFHLINNDIECVAVPPGFRLELYKMGLWFGESYTVYGKMRVDLGGPACHCLPYDFRNKVSSVKLFRHYD